MKTNQTLRKRLIIILLTILSISQGNFRLAAQGTGKAMYFPGTTSFEHINIGDSLSNKLDTASFTIEMWINFNNAGNGDPAFVGNKDWNSGANTGFAWALNSTTTLRFNFRPASGTRRDYNTTVSNLQGNWNHIAMVVDRKGYLTAYVNGLQTGTPIFIAADSLRSLDGVLPIRLGSDGTGTYNYNGVSRFNGKLDDVRFWLSKRTQTEIRDNMCHKLTGSEAGLLAYYPMNDTNSTFISNQAAAYSSLFTGNFVNSPVRIASSAPVGDTSVNIYASSLSAATLSLNNAAKGNFKALNLSGSFKGFHIYRIDTVSTVSNISNPGTNRFGYGVFPVDTATSTPGIFDVQYDYTTYANAVTYSSTIDLYKRFSADSVWNSTSAGNNTTTHILSLSGASKRNEFIIGNFATPGICNAPTNLTVTNVTTNSATISWTSGGSNRWNIEYGAGSFTPGTGTRVKNLTTAAIALSGLAQNTTYKVYVQDTCLSLLNASSLTSITFTTAKDYSIFGSGYAMNLPGTSANEHVNLDTAMSTALATTNFSVEMWINFNTFNDDESFIGNKNWNSGANIGFVWGRSNKSGMPASSLWFNFTPTGGTRRDWHLTIPGLNLIKNWNHVAATIDRKGDVAFYINGVKANILQHYIGGALQSTVNTNIAADSNKSIRGTLPVRLGQDGTGTYSVKFSGKMDEVRIWNTVRTQQQIRDYMCRKLPVTAGGLLSYYRFDTAAGPIATNMATATYGTLNGVLTNNPTRVPSGAAIGDTSAYLYGLNLAGSTLSLASSQNGAIIADSLKPSYTGLQLYRLDTIPNTTSDIADLGSNKVYYGVFPIDTGVSSTGSFTSPASSYRLRYDYTTYPAAVAAASNLHLYNRAAGDVLLWTDLGAVNTVAAKTMTATGLRNRREVILADFTAQSCPNVSNIRVDSLGALYSRLTWNSIGTKWYVQYGPQGFAFGQGKIDTVRFVAKDTIRNLVPDSYYDVYVRTACGTDSSKWAGPFNFKTPDQCPAPNLLQSVHLGGDSVKISWNNTGAAVYNLQWGQQGFAFGTGIPVNNIMGTSYILSGLSNTLIYDVYIQDTCSGGGKSKWFGPLSFQATGFVAPTGVAYVGSQTAFKVMPNPAQSFIQIQRDDNSVGAVHIRLIDMQGRIMMQQVSSQFPLTHDVSQYPAGMYMLKCTNGETQYNVKLSVSK